MKKKLKSIDLKVSSFVTAQKEIKGAELVTMAEGCTYVETDASCSTCNPYQLCGPCD